MKSQITSSFSRCFCASVSAQEEHPSGGLFIRHTSVPDVKYRLQRAASLSGSWSDVATNTAPASGLVEFTNRIRLPVQRFTARCSHEFTCLIIAIIGALPSVTTLAQSPVLINAFTNPAPSKDDLFGHSVAALGSDRVIIGASGRTSDSTCDASCVRTRSRKQ